MLECKFVLSSRKLLKCSHLNCEYICLFILFTQTTTSLAFLMISSRYAYFHYQHWSSSHGWFIGWHIFSEIRLFFMITEQSSLRLQAEPITTAGYYPCLWYGNQQMVKYGEYCSYGNNLCVTGRILQGYFPLISSLLALVLWALQPLGR